MDNLGKLEAHYGITLPPGYRAWSRERYTDYRQSDEQYLWVHEAEWIPPKEIQETDLSRVNVLPGLIPFAFTGAGDHWCWLSQANNPSAEYDVLLCYHDEELADLFAPTFPAWFYRSALDYASGGFDADPEGIDEARAHLRLWSERLSEICPGAWAQHLASLADTAPFTYDRPSLRGSYQMFGFITAMDVEATVVDQLGPRYLKEKVAWGTFDV